MLYSVSGKFSLRGENFAVIDVGLMGSPQAAGLGLKIFTNRRNLDKMPALGEDAKMFCHLHMREDGLELYGFLDEAELNFFELLISVSGVGPKSALSILEITELKNLAAAIKENRPDLLTRASGIGRKTAERIILELRTKVQSKEAGAVVQKMESDADLVEALANLGYKRDAAKAALAKVGEKVIGLDARLKEALKILGGKLS